MFKSSLNAAQYLQDSQEYVTSYENRLIAHIAFFCRSIPLPRKIERQQT